MLSSCGDAYVDEKVKNKSYQYQLNFYNLI